MLARNRIAIFLGLITAGMFVAGFSAPPALAAADVAYTLSANRTTVNVGETVTIYVGMNTQNDTRVSHSVASLLLDGSGRWYDIVSIQPSGFDNVVRSGVITPTSALSQYSNNVCALTEQTSQNGVTGPVTVEKITLRFKSASLYPLNFLSNGQCPLSAYLPEGNSVRSIDDSDYLNITVNSPSTTIAPVALTPSPNMPSNQTSAKNATTSNSLQTNQTPASPAHQVQSSPSPTSGMLRSSVNANEDKAGQISSPTSRQHFSTVLRSSFKLGAYRNENISLPIWVGLSLTLLILSIIIFVIRHSVKRMIKRAITSPR